MKLVRNFFLLAFLFGHSFVITAQEAQLGEMYDVSSDEIQLEEILVEGTLLADTVLNTPKNVSVVTDLDIEQTPGKEIIDVLSAQAGISVLSYSGHDKQSGIDLRGMGATANSNVLILVDGIRLNAPDLSGADLSSIAMDDIEKIEIIRGAESVVYGDGAVGGVVRVYTKKIDQEPQLTIKSSVRSYETTALSARYTNQLGGIGAGISGSYHATDGYRDNGFFTKSSVGLRLERDLGRQVMVSLMSNYKTDRYGLPGPVSIDAIDSIDKRNKTDHPDDYGKTEDQRLTAGVEINLQDYGKIKLTRGYRFRKNDYILGYNENSELSDDQQTSHIDESSKSQQLVYTLPYAFAALQHTFKGGLDHYQSYYVRESITQNERHNSNTESLGAFLSNRWRLGEKNGLILGYRHNTFTGKFRKDSGSLLNSRFTWENGELTEKQWTSESYDISFSYKKTEETHYFVSAASSFRTPNVDEFAVADESLQPQSSQNIELGMRYKSVAGLEASMNLFQVTTEDEIHYGTDPETGESENRNYDETTLRQGLEAQFKTYATDFLYFWANGSLLNATFVGEGTKVPLVPDYKVTLAMEYGLTPQAILAMTGTFVGERFDGNDETNQRYRKLEAYHVFNAKFTYDFYRGRKLYLGINNLFNTLYANLAYSETYYPMPTRNLYCELKWNF